MRYSPKILGPNNGIYGTIFGQSATIFFDRVCYFYVFLLEKMNNMLDV